MVNSHSNTDRELSAPLLFGSGTEPRRGPGETKRRGPSSSLPKPESSGKRSISEQWLSLHGDALYRYALMLVADQHHAEDLVQETLLAALKSHSRYAAASSERTWLIATLRNKAADHVRRDRRQGEQLADVDPAVEGNFNRFGKWRKPPCRWTPNPQSLPESKEFRAILFACMHALPVPVREAFNLPVVEDLDASETCRMLEITSDNLWTKLYRARERLRRCLESKWLIKVRK